MENQNKDRLGLIEGLLKNCAVAVFALDTHHRVIYWNMACEQLTGIAADEIMGTDRHWMAFYDHKRPCLSDILLDGELEEGFEHYNVFGKSTLLPDGLHAAGWYPGLGGQERYIIFDAAPVYATDGRLIAAVETLQDITRRKRLEEEKDLLVTQLREAVTSIKQLQGLLPICSTCKKIRDDKGYWNKLECYIEAHSTAEFTHSMCPECEAKFYKACEKAVSHPFKNGA